MSRGSSGEDSGWDLKLVELNHELKSALQRWLEHTESQSRTTCSTQIALKV